MNFNDNTHVNMTNVTDPNIKMGLDDKICDDPKYFCLCHKVYLNDADVKRKSCRQKMTLDMMGFVKCRWLMESEEYVAMIEKRNQIIRNNKLSNVNRKAAHFNKSVN